MTSAIHFDRLSCGMPFCYQQSDDSRLLSISVWINAGSVTDLRGKQGLAHLCEHMLLRPLVDTTSRAHHSLVQTGALMNARTDPEWVVISAQAPMEQSRILIDLFASLVRKPYLEVNGMYAEKEVILHEIRGEDLNSEDLLVKRFRNSAFEGSFSNQPVGGTTDTLNALEIEDVLGYYKQYLNSSKMMITAHGNCRGMDVISSLDEAFKEFPENPVQNSANDDTPDTLFQSKPNYHPVKILEEMVASGPSSHYGMLMGSSSVPRSSKDYWTALGFEVLMSDGPESLLNQWLRNDRLMIYGVASMTEAYSNWGNQYFILRLAYEQVEEALEYLAQQWQIVDEFLTEDRLKALKNKFTSRALLSITGMQDRMTLMRDMCIDAFETPKLLERANLESFVTAHIRELNVERLNSYIQQNASWHRVSLVGAPI